MGPALAMQLTPVIGLEIHVQLNTKTKLMDRSLNEYTPDEPNKNISPFNTGQPGALPVLNRAAVQKAIAFGVAVGGEIPEYIRFDRKNYFYPDLPAGYQISQWAHPIVRGGSIEFYVEDKQTGEFQRFEVNLIRAHLETDAAKLMHFGGKTMVDFNRSGVPLVEIVTEPQIRSAAQAMAFVNELQLLVRRINISGGDMEKGQMRFDCNISLQTAEQLARNQLPEYKVEVKNINSVRALGRAIEFEIARQTAILERGEKPPQETRGWRDDLNQSEPQRFKEDAHDYRYFPEPDLPIVRIRPQDIPDVTDLPELPKDQRQRYLNMGLSLQVANTFVTQVEVGNLFDATVGDSKELEILRKTVANIITGNLIAMATRLERPIGELVSTENLVALAKLFAERKINNQGLQIALEIIVENPDLDATEVVMARGLLQISDDTSLLAFVEMVIESHPQVVQQYKNGKTQSLDFLVGQCMKESRGKGNPVRFRELLVEKLK